MTELVIVGTVALDDVETPFGKVEGALGGAATYSAYAASYFTRPGIVAVVGHDFPQKHLDFLGKRGIDTAGIVKEGKTFRWQGFYEYDMNEAKTLRTELNCLESFKAELPEDYKNTDYLFLANIDPVLQLQVLEQMENPKLTAMDTMNFWIEHKNKELKETIEKVDMLFINDAEARQLFKTPNLVKAASKAMDMGPRAVVIKKGEHGALLFCDDKHFSAPAYPMENIRDPTGAGDSFAGGFMGWMAKTKDLSERNMRKAVIYGSTIASFNAEGFSLENLKKTKLDDIENRYSFFKEIREF